MKIKKSEMNCNLDTDKQNTVILPCPEIIKPFRQNKKTICIDAEIVPVVEHLWQNGIVTLSSCCGHGTQPPSLVIADTYCLESIVEIRLLIAEIDPDNLWDIFQWRLVKDPDELPAMFPGVREYVDVKVVA